MVSHLVGGEAHASDACAGSSPAPTANGSVGHLESPSRSKRDVPSGLARSTRAATASFDVERTANGEAVRPEPGGSH